MTCIAAIRTTDSILIGGDSAATRKGAIRILGTPKVFQIDDYMFGTAGPLRLNEILRYRFKPPPKREGVRWDEFLLGTFVPTLWHSLGKFGMPKKSSILVAARGGGGIFEIDGAGHISAVHEPYLAIGSGADYALGSLHSSSGNARRRLLKALEAAARFQRIRQTAVPHPGTSRSWFSGSV